jgi:hypothetical protein
MVFEVFQKLSAILAGRTILYEYLSHGDESHVLEKNKLALYYQSKNNEAYRLDTLFSWLENTSTLFNTFPVF